MRIKTAILSVLAITAISCAQENTEDRECFIQARNNGILANEGYNRCLKYMFDWIDQADSASGLIPENLMKGKEVWSPHNSAADNYPFMVLTSYLLNRELYSGKMTDILKTERLLTSRLESLPAVYSFSKQSFRNAEPDTFQIIFGTSEYIKDGLLPLAEYIGISPWSDRMIEMLDDLSKYIRIAEDVKGSFFRHSVNTEINGELLQTLSRIYWMTGNEKYLEWAIEIGDYYLLDHPAKILENSRLRLRDHGCEVIGGLSELYAAVHFARKVKKEAYQAGMHAIFDRILEVGRNEDGMFYNEVNMATGEVVDDRIVDNWGYIYNAYYTIFLLDNTSEYRAAVLKPLKILHQKYRNYAWERESSDGYADAIESGINLYNREPVPELKEWIDSEIKVMWSMQDTKRINSGIIEGWHGDGNFARTTIMYCLWKTNDVTVQPWRKDIHLGTFLRDSSLYISLSAEERWEGTLFPGNERHREILNLPIDYPRINQFPEWFAIREGDYYSVTIDDRETKPDGATLKQGIRLALKNNLPCQIRITKITSADL